MAAALGFSAAEELHNWARETEAQLRSTQTQLADNVTQLTHSKRETADAKQQLADSEEGRADEQRQAARVQQQLTDSSTANTALTSRLDVSEAKVATFNALLAENGCGDIMDIQDLIDQLRGDSRGLRAVQRVLADNGCISIDAVPAWLERMKARNMHTSIAQAAAAAAAVHQKYRAQLGDLLAQVRAVLGFLESWHAYTQVAAGTGEWAVGNHELARAVSVMTVRNPTGCVIACMYLTPGCMNLEVAPTVPACFSQQSLRCLLLQVDANEGLAAEREQQLQEQDGQLDEAQARIDELQAELDEARAQLDAKDLQLEQMQDSEQQMVVSIQGCGAQSSAWTAPGA